MRWGYKSAVLTLQNKGSYGLNFKVMKIKITKDNFFIKSKADFKKVEKAPEREPDYISPCKFVVWEDDIEHIEKDESETKIYLCEEDEDDDYGFTVKEYKVVETFIGRYGDRGYKCISEDTSSKYWYTDEGVYRESDHWGECRKCYWTLEGNEEDGERVVGFCRWEDFEGEIEMVSGN